MIPHTAGASGRTRRTRRRSASGRARNRRSRSGGRRLPRRQRSLQAARTEGGSPPPMGTTTPRRTATAPQTAPGRSAVGSATASAALRSSRRAAGETMPEMRRRAVKRPEAGAAAAARPSRWKLLREAGSSRLEVVGKPRPRWFRHLAAACLMSWWTGRSALLTGVLQAIYGNTRTGFARCL